MCNLGKAGKLLLLLLLLPSLWALVRTSSRTTRSSPHAQSDFCWCVLQVTDNVSGVN